MIFFVKFYAHYSDIYRAPIIFYVTFFNNIFGPALCVEFDYLKFIYQTFAKVILLLPLAVTSRRKEGRGGRGCGTWK